MDASATVVSWRADGGELIDTVFTHDARTKRTSGRRFGILGECYESASYPATDQILQEAGTFLVLADDPTADQAERSLLAEWGMDGVLAAAADEPGAGAWLVELYADARTRPLADVEAALRLLVAEAVRGAGAGAAALRAVG